MRRCKRVGLHTPRYGDRGGRGGVYLGIKVRDARGERAGAVRCTWGRRGTGTREQGTPRNVIRRPAAHVLLQTTQERGERQHGLRMSTAAACRPRPCFCRCSVKTALCAEACVCGREERPCVCVARGMMAGDVKVSPAIVLCYVPCSLSHSPLSAGVAQEDTAKGCTPRGG